MAGVSLEVTLSTVASEAMLARVQAAVADLSRPMDAIGSSLVTSTQMRFETGTGPDGARWPVSAAARRRSGQTLVDRGHLRDSIVHDPHATGVSVGSNLVYSRVHQLGGQAGRNHALTVPARPYLGVDDADKAMMIAEIEAFLDEVLS